jgi:hypothetical protein
LQIKVCCRRQKSKLVANFQGEALAEKEMSWRSDASKWLAFELCNWLQPSSNMQASWLCGRIRKAKWFTLLQLVEGIANATEGKQKHT